MINQKMIINCVFLTSFGMPTSWAPLASPSTKVFPTMARTRRWKELIFFPGGPPPVLARLAFASAPAFLALDLMSIHDCN